jgi:hypothetical protein
MEKHWYGEKKMTPRIVCTKQLPSSNQTWLSWFYHIVTIKISIYRGFPS